jgi:ABC-type polysaccharide/polyol phosphate export permease
MFLELALGISIALWTSVLNARARDVRFTMAFVLGFWFFLTPIIYPLSKVPAAFQTIASLNPMTAPIEMVRIGLFDIGQVPLVAICSTVATILIVGGGGLWFFMRSERLALDSL